jgi:hypothetical protein
MARWQGAVRKRRAKDESALDAEGPRTARIRAHALCAVTDVIFERAQLSSQWERRGAQRRAKDESAPDAEGPRTARIRAHACYAVIDARSSNAVSPGSCASDEQRARA